MQVVGDAGGEDHQAAGQKPAQDGRLWCKDEGGKEKGEEDGDAAETWCRRVVHLALVGNVQRPLVERPAAQERHHDQ